MMTKLEAAEQRVKAADDEVRRLKSLLAEAQASCASACKDAQAARVERDAELPRAVVRPHSRGWGNTLEYEVCVIKRTAKSVWVRLPGGKEDHQYRLNKSGAWAPYPKPFIGCTSELVLADGVCPEQK